ncbi:MAG: rRNA maturation RNase YbeY [Alphaproteobacteria bacterium]
MTTSENSMYQIYLHAGKWEPLELDNFFKFLTSRLGLTSSDLVTIVLADDSYMQTLNRTHRGKDAPTNVLSYASDLNEELGDLIFGFETICAECAKQNTGIKQHMMHLIVHGSLHLLGYDHESEGEAAIMEALEIKVLDEFGVPNPYEPAL